MGSAVSSLRIIACVRRQVAVAVLLAAATAFLFAQAQQPDADALIQMLREHQYAQAAASADQMLAQHPHDCRLLSLRGLALNGLERPVEAEASFREAVRTCPNDLLALEGAAEIAYGRHEPEAEQLLQRILNLRPGDVTAHAMLASLYRGKGDCQAALPHFRASQALFASRPKFQEAYGFCLAKAGQYTQAAGAYQAVLDELHDPVARYNLALVQWRLRDAKAALETLSPLLNSSPDETVLALGSRIAEDAGDTPLAVKLLRSAILTNPKDRTNYLEFAQISFNHESFQVGIDVLNAGLTQLPDAAPLYVARGILEVQLSQSDQAISDFERAHRLEPQMSLAMDAIGIVESQQYKESTALALFGRQARLHPRDALLQYLYAEALADARPGTDTMQKAIGAAEKSVEIEPDYAPARDLLALLWLRVQQPEKALIQAEAALKIQPDDDVALFHEIMARRRLGQTEQVRTLAKQLAEMRSQNARKEQAGHHYLLREEPGS